MVLDLNTATITDLNTFMIRLPTSKNPDITYARVSQGGKPR